MEISDDGSLMGCVVFDSEKNREHIEPGYDEFFIPISQGKYSFIDHDSFLECLRLKPATLSNIRQLERLTGIGKGVIHRIWCAGR